MFWEDEDIWYEDSDSDSLLDNNDGDLDVKAVLNFQIFEDDDDKSDEYSWYDN